VKRLSDIVALHVEQAIRDLEVLALERDLIEWEVIPFVAPDGSVGWLVGIGLPVSVTGDNVMPFALLSDPHGRDEISRIVRAMHAAAAAQAAELAEKSRKAANGHREQPGGLIVP
jgi:hypothetical protein